jgi:hypothetical protein
MDSLGLQCINTKCSCLSNYFYNEESYCEFKKNFNELCDSLNLCDESQGLLCDSTKGFCSCNILLNIIIIQFVVKIIFLIKQEIL